MKNGTRRKLSDCQFREDDIERCLRSLTGTREWRKRRRDTGES